MFHGLTDGLGALNFMKYLTERYLELAAGEQYKKERESGEGQAGLSGGKRHAPGEAKEAADFVTDDVEKDGLLKAFEKLELIE